MNPAEQLVKLAGHCFLPKLARNVEDIDNHPEYYDRQNHLDINFPSLLDIVSKAEIKNHPKFHETIMPTLLMLYLERSVPSPWNDDKCLEFAQNLNTTFQTHYGFSLDNVLCTNFCNTQVVFDNLMKELNIKVNTQDFQKYPALIKTYNHLMKNLKEFKLTYQPVALFPICLLIMEDYVLANRIQGLKCCTDILHCLTDKHFQDGNYYEVIFSSLKKIITEKKLEVTTLVHECLLEFIRILPNNTERELKTDEIFGIMLEQIHMESNLYRKTACFAFIKNIILIHQVNCVNKKLLKIVLCENIHVCCNDAVADILLVDVLQVLQVWIRYCWCVWRLSSDHKMLSALIKLLYVSRKEKIASEIQDLIVSLINLCTKDERKMILKNLQQSEITSPEFQEKLEEIKKDIS